MNQVLLVGRVAQDPELHLTENGKKKSDLVLAVPRQFKNVDGEYETDFFDCILWTVIAESTNEYVKIGDVVGVKGRLQTGMIEREDGSKYKKVEIVAERVSFISSKNPKEKTIEINENEIIPPEEEPPKEKTDKKKK